MTDKPKYEHTAKDAIVKTDDKVVDVTNLDYGFIKTLKKHNPDAKFVFSVDPTNLPPIGEGGVLKDIIGNIEKVRREQMGAIIVEDGK